MGQLTVLLATLLILTIATACSGVNGDSAASNDRISEPHVELKIIDTTGSNAQKVKGKSAKISAGDAPTAQAISFGTMYLEAQIKPYILGGTQLQASDVTVKGGSVYVAYNAVDTNGVVIKKGAVEHLTPLACDNTTLFGYNAFCTTVSGRIDFPTTDIFAVDSDGTNVYAVGSTSDESAAPKFARLYKLGLNSVTKVPTAILGTTILPSYAGTGVASLGSSVLVTTGTSTDSNRMGGLSVVNTSTMAVTGSQSLYDARSVGFYKPNSSTNPTTAFVTRGKVDSTNAGAVVEYGISGTSAPLRTIATGGNTIAESKSTVQVGNQLLLVSLGDQGFKVVCKATGATLLSKAAPVVSGIPSSRTVTNSVAAAPGYIFAANGEAGLYVYRFTKSSAFNTNYCQGVTATLMGRLALDSDDNDSTYLNGELSANSVYYMPIFNLFNIITAKLVIVASGNKGISLLNVTGLNLNSDDVDDF